LSNIPHMLDVFMVGISYSHRRKFSFKRAIK